MKKGMLAFEIILILVNLTIIIGGWFQKVSTLLISACVLNLFASFIRIYRVQKREPYL
ncbi:hypothetical protein ACVRYP_05080 [Streptococcus rifensis]